MATIDSPSQSGVSAEVEPTFKATRVQVKPYDYQSFGAGGVTRTLGHYRVAGTTAAILVGGGATVATFRYADANSFAVVTRVTVGVSVTAAVAAQRTDPMQLFVARGYTAADSTNATTLSTAGNGGKMRTSMATANAVVQVASAAAGISGGTRTNDPSPIEILTLQNLVAIGSGQPITDMYNILHVGAHPLVLAPNEGLILNWGTQVLGGGTVEISVAFDWAEVTTF